MSDWISVDDRFPELYEKVLVSSLDCDDEEMTSTAHYNGVKLGFVGINRVRYDATHWMSLPSPPEGK